MKLNQHIVVSDRYVHISGQIPGGGIGIFVIKRYKRIFQLEPIMIEIKLSNDKVKYIYKNLWKKII